MPIPDCSETMYSVRSHRTHASFFAPQYVYDPESIGDKKCQESNSVIMETIGVSQEKKGGSDMRAPS